MANTQEELRARVPRLDYSLGRFQEGLQALEGYSAKHLVHGDYYPAHVMMDEHSKVVGLLDFSRQTVIGDPGIDRGEALSSFEDPQRPEGSAEHGEYARGLVIERYGQEALRNIRTYQLYYALIFSDCAPFDPVTYDWCLRILNGEIWSRE